MNLFGFEINFKKKNNPNSNSKYILEKDFYRAIDGLHHRMTEINEALNKRIDDVIKLK